MYFWVKFSGHPAGTVEAANADLAKTIGNEKTGKLAVSAAALPYPASPIIFQRTDGPYGPCPPFCFQPEQCAGKSSCPRPRACSD